MEHRTRLSKPVLGAASALFKRLNDAGIRYGIFKSSRNTAAALAGEQDLDILIDRKDYRHFCSIASACDAIRSTNHESLTSPGREDWFVPDFHRAKYLHLDIHVNIRLGGKFNKRYPFYDYDDIQCWEMTSFGRCAIPIVSPEDEARITLSRIAFRAGSPIFGSWQKLKGDWAHEINDLLFPTMGTDEKIISYPAAGTALQCRVRKSHGSILVHRRDLAKIRRVVKARNAASPFSFVTDPLRNAARAGRYFASRLLCRALPGLIVDRRQPVSGGIVIAMVAPDGMGKTTQVRRMSKLFGWKFSCVGLYLGSGDGKGWWIRRLIRTVYIRRRSKIKETYLNDAVSGTKRRSIKAYIGSYLLGAWGLLIALERYQSVLKARRLAERGLIVFCDRWPQALQDGFLDGPTPQRGKIPMGLLRKWELSLYQKMAQFRPDIAIQLIGNYALSEARKPGELTREEFDKRIHLMSELRKAAPDTRVVDAGARIDDVSKSLFKLIWSEL